MAQQVVRAEHIKTALAKKHPEEVFLTEVKTGPTYTYLQQQPLYVLDAVAIKKSWSSPCITAYEVKVSRSDFIRDTKWPAYMQFCHRLSFACPAGMIQKEELPDDIGLVWFDPETGKLTTKRSAKFRKIEMPNQMFYHLVISHMQSDRHPFFNTAQEFWKAFVENKHEKQLLGYHVKGKIRDHILNLERRITKVDTLEAQNKKYEDFVKALNDVLRPLGIWFNPSYGWSQEQGLANLKASLASSGGLSKRVVDKVYELRNAVQAVLDMMPEKDS